MLLSTYSIKHRTTVFVLAVIIIVAGAVAYMQLPRESAPDIKFPYIMVNTSYTGASPSDIESLLTYPLERKLKNLTDVKEMTSTSSEGISSIFIEFEPDVDIDTALQKVRDKVDEAKPDLPDDLEDDPAVEEISANDHFPVMFINISGDVGPVRLKKIADDMEDDIEALPGVLDAQVLGGLEREILVEFDLDRISAYQLTMSEIINTITLNNQNTPGGSLDVGEAKYNLKSPAEFVSPDEIDHLVVAVHDGKPIYLSDVAVAKDSFKDRDSFSRINGQDAVTVKVTKRSGENMLSIAQSIKAVIKQHDDRLPEGIHFTITSDGSKEVKTMVADLENNILCSLVLVCLVVLVGLGWRNALLVALAIPFSMLVSFYVLKLLGITLNMVVLFSLVLALGMLVDNAIVIVENIYRQHTEEGKPLIQAAIEGTAEVGWPVVSSTATTVAAFLPLIFWPGIMGQFMGYLPKTVIIVLVSSLLVALVITPVAATVLIKKSKKAAAPDGAHRGPIMRSYLALLRFCLIYRTATLLFFFALLFIVIFAYKNSGLGTVLFPDTDPNRITVSIEAPEGTNVWRVDEFARQAEQIVSRYGNIENVTISVGNGSGVGSGVNGLRLNVDMVDRQLRTNKGPQDGKTYFKDSDQTMEAIRKDLSRVVVGARVTIEEEENGPPSGPPINVELTGDDYATLAGLAHELRGDIQDLDGLVDLQDDYKAGLPEVNIIVDKERAALLGLNAYLIGQLVKASVNGIKVGDYREAEDEYDITARLAEDQRQSLQDIIRLRVPAPDGTQVPLTSVARIESTSGLSSIKHIKSKRVVTVFSNVADGFTGPALLKHVRTTIEKGRPHLRLDDVTDPQGLVQLLRTSQAGGRQAPELTALISESTQKLLDDAQATPGNIAQAALKDLNHAILADPPMLSWAQLHQNWPQVFAPPADPLRLPQGYSVRYTGENEDAEESQAFMQEAFVTAVLLIFLVLVVQFNSVLTPFIILISVILSFIGVFLGMIVAHQSFSIIMSGMGVISLAGVVVNNAIVLLDYTNQLRQRGMRCLDAILEAGATRMRPVLLTAITTILGLVPMAVGISFNFLEWHWEKGSDSSQWWGPMAVAVIFGLAVATALTLLVVPTVYSLLFDFKHDK